MSFIDNFLARWQEYRHPGYYEEFDYHWTMTIDLDQKRRPRHDAVPVNDRAVDLGVRARAAFVGDQPVLESAGQRAVAARDRTAVIGAEP